MMMKKTILLLAVIITAVTGSYAQKGKVSSASTLKDSGKLDKALEAIRITSYNVCYTKLLRNICPEQESSCQILIQIKSRYKTGFLYNFNLLISYNFV